MEDGNYSSEFCIEEVRRRDIIFRRLINKTYGSKLDPTAITKKVFWLYYKKHGSIKAPFVLFENFQLQLPT